MTREKSQKRYEIHLVSHTHWDREWYDTFEAFRTRLVKLVDKLLWIMESDKGFRYFTLDGQTIVIEDYLQIKPENSKLLRKYIKQGRIFVGPWYVLPDEFLESGESMIRNLLLGHKIAREFGGVMKVGYVPDPFGHVSQLPQILNGFDIDSFIFTRGLGEVGEKLGSEFIWCSPDGSKVLAIRQSAWYGDSADLGKEPVDFEKALEVINHSKESLLRFARTRYLLSNNGEDHREPQPEIPKIIKHLNQRLGDAVVVHSNFGELVKKVKSVKPELGVLEGELRGIRYAPLLPGVLSSRMYLKQANERAQTKVEKIAEPLAAAAWMEGFPYPGEILWQAWKYLLQCHPHDSICGCSIDGVHRDVMQRFVLAGQILDKVIEDSFSCLLEKIDTDFKNAGFSPIVVFNTLNWKRSGVAKATLFYQKSSPMPENVVVLDERGAVLPAQILEVRESRWLGFREMDIIFSVTGIPPCGYKVYALKTVEAEAVVKTYLKAGENFVENEYYRVEVKENGALNVKDKISGLISEGVLVFEDTEDAGDEYNFSPAKNSNTITADGKKVRISAQERGPVSATLKIEFDWDLPKSLDKDRSGRSEELVSCPLSTFVTLYSGVRRIDFRTVFENNAKDHRLRAVFSTNIKQDYSFAEGQFDVIKRIAGFPPAESSVEAPCPTCPQQSFLSVSDESKGFTLINRGLPEYEALKGRNGLYFALTLLRCVGWLSRDDLITRQGYNAGPAIATPEAQCLGHHEFFYSLILHQSDWQKNKIWKEAYNHGVDLLAKQIPQKSGSLPKEFSFLEIKPDSLIVSAMKKAENQERLVLRIFSFEPSAQDAEIRFGRRVGKAYLLNLNEEKKSQLKLAGDSVCFSIKPFQIITIGIEF